MRHHQPQSPILSFEKHPALHWHQACEEGVVMQVACLCLFMYLPDCWSAHQRNQHSEKTKRDKTEIEKNKIYYSADILILHLCDTFPGQLLCRIFIWRIAFPGQNRLPGNVRVIIKSVYPVHPSEGTEHLTVSSPKGSGIAGGAWW